MVVGLIVGGSRSGGEGETIAPIWSKGRRQRWCMLWRRGSGRSVEEVLVVALNVAGGRWNLGGVDSGRKKEWWDWVGDQSG